jgi:pyruvate/2-oxoacid:ferredoxin oxidoreductase beta subunit
MFDLVKKAKGLVSHGVSACAGCGLELIIRHVLDVVEANTTMVIPPGCSALFCGYGPETGIRISALQGNLENTAAYAAGIRAGYEAQGKEDITVLGFAGDGATVDIGLQALSGALERRDRIMYVCYDNEAYMNTGIQGSSSSPLGAWTTTTPEGKHTRRKDLLRIVIAHEAPYCASASVANLPDLRRKVKKAKETKGPSVLHIHCPCPTGWGYSPAKTIEVARKAVQSGAWVLYEYEEGRITVNQKPKSLIPLEEYLGLQSRFKHIDPDLVTDMRREIESRYAALLACEAS